MMTPEDAKSRRGEPVLVRDEFKDKWYEGYIEFGDEKTGCISVATEPAGARIVIYAGEHTNRLKKDPGGKRPLRDSRGIVWAGDPDHVSLADAATTIDELARLIDSKSELVPGWPSALRKIARSLEVHANGRK